TPPDWPGSRRSTRCRGPPTPTSIGPGPTSGPSARWPTGARPADGVSRRNVAFDGDAVQHPFDATDVTDHRVLDGAVVPHQDVARLPAVPARELRAARLHVEVLQERRALLHRHALEVLRVVGVHEQ